MGRTLYLVRHGQTMFNVKGIIQGWCDSPLTEQGEEQARRVGAYFRHAGISFDHHYASTLTRTQKTLRCIAGDVPFTAEDGLREWFFGAFEAERVSIMPPRPWGDFFLMFGGESQDGFRARICGTLADIMSRPEHECVLAVSHGSAVREFMDSWIEDSRLDVPGVPGNCSVMRYDFDGERFALVEKLEQEDLARILEK